MRAWRIARLSTCSLEKSTRRAISGSPICRDGRSIADILRQGGQAENISVNGWIRSLRKQKRVAFAAISDGSTTDSLQAVLKPEDATE